MGFTKWMLPEKKELIRMINEEPERVRTLARRDAIMGPADSMKELDKFMKKIFRNEAKH